MILVVIVLNAIGLAAWACDDHSGKCEIEAWTWYQSSTILTIEGSVTCNEGLATIRLYEGDEFIGVADGLVNGHALQAVHLSIFRQLDDLNIKTSISRL